MAGEREYPVHMPDLPALLARLREASGPDRELDCDLFWQFERGHAGVAFRNAAMGTYPTLPERLGVGLGRTGVRVASPHYTASIDSALALVEAKRGARDWQITLNRIFDRDHEEHWDFRILDWSADREDEGDDPPKFYAVNYQAPLAILIALVSALINQGELK